MKLMNLLAVAIAGACLTAIVYYLKPPNGDKRPISQGALDHYARAEARQGDIDIQRRQGDIQ